MMLSQKIEARFYEKEKDGSRCTLCPRKCFLKAGQTGFCGVREAGAGGKLYTLNYGRIEALALDPVEKKPLARFYPGSFILSAGTAGCNLACSFCQNHEIAVRRLSAEERVLFVSPEELAEKVLNMDESLGLAFTYNEPSVWFEYIYDTASLIKKICPEKKIVFVSNGFISDEPLRQLLPLIDAANFDLKGSERFYRTVCSAASDSSVQDAVERTITAAYAAGCHVELTLLLIEGENTDKETIEQLLDFIASVDRRIPLHLSRYFPCYRMALPPTDLTIMRRVYMQAAEKLEYVYTGNLTLREKFFVCGMQERLP